MGLEIIDIVGISIVCVTIIVIVSLNVTAKGKRK